MLPRLTSVISGNQGKIDMAAARDALASVL